MSHTIRSAAITALGETDETVSVQGAKVDPALEESAGTVRAGYFAASAFGPVRAAVAGSSRVDGVAPAIIEPVAVRAPRTGQHEPRVGLFASDPAHMGGFGAIRTASGKVVSLGDLAAGEVYLTTAAADDLAARRGDAVQVLAGTRRLTARVRDVVDFDGTGTDGGSLLIGLPAAQRLLGHPGQLNHILVSNRGDAIGGAALSDAVARELAPTLAPLGLRAETVKQDAITAADEAGSAFLSFFTTFGAFSIAAGILLIFLIFVMLAAERRSELGIARAVGTRRGHLVQMFLYEGVAYDVAAAAVGALLGVAVAYGMVLLIADAFAGNDTVDVTFSVTARSVAVAYSIGVLLTLAVVTLSARKVSRMNIVSAIRDLPEPPASSSRRRSLLLPVAGLLAGAALVASGIDGRQAVPFGLGVSLIVLAVVGLARAAGVSDRIARSAGGLVLVLWFVFPFQQWLLGDMSTDFSIFILSGLVVVVGATWLIMYNADLLLRGASRAVGHLSGVAPVFRLAMAYPLRSLFRTGITLAMFTLVVLTLVVGATTSGAFTNAFNDLESFGGGFDVRATTAPASPIANLPAALQHSPGRVATDVTAVGSQSVVPVQARQADAAGGYNAYLARGLDRGFLDHTTYGFAAMARGYRSPSQVWRALRDHPGLAVVDGLAAPRRAKFGFGNLSDFQLSGFYVEDGAFAPVPVTVRGGERGRPLRLRVIGVLADTLPLEMAGLWTSQPTLASHFGARAVPTLHLLALRDGADAPAVARELESRFLSAGVEADALSDVLDTAIGANRTFNALVQGFMALGLVVGVAALGVITARSVVERRQQIGVLRAIGFRRRMVQACFLLESSFIALTAIVLGTGLGLPIAYWVIHDSQQQPSWSNLGFDVPWLNLGIVFVAVYAVAMATTLLPSLRAARVYPAEALRYQ
jgi:putative ABC transport system permease protein